VYVYFFRRPVLETRVLTAPQGLLDYELRWQWNCVKNESVEDFMMDAP
jgi:hypothetical protein